MGVFNQKDAIKEARIDERAHCEREKKYALECLEKRLRADHKLDISRLTAKIYSLEARLDESDKNKDFYMRSMQHIREIECDQNRISADLKSFVKNLRDGMTKNYQDAMFAIEQIEKVEDNVRSVREKAETRLIE